MRGLLIGVCCWAGWVLAVPAHGQAWRDLRPLPAAQQEVGTAVAEGKVYVVGGFDGAGRSVNTSWRYDPGTDQWERLPDLPAPQPLNHVGLAAVDGVVYAVGGLTGAFAAVDSTWRFDPGSNQWTARAAMPSARGAMGVAEVDGLIYAAGGLPASRSDHFAVYDPALDQWRVLANMPTGRDHHAAAGVGGRFYAISGRRAGVLLGAVEEFDPATGQWRSRRSIPTPRAGIAAGVVGGRIYVFGGEGNPGDPQGIFHDVEVYDPFADGWRALAPMPVGRHGVGAGVLGRAIHLPGGATRQGFGAVAHHDVFEPCYPDCDGDGRLDFFDFLCFQDAFLAGDPYGDCDGDGVLDFFDFLCFQDEFLVGCP